MHQGRNFSGGGGGGGGGGGWGGSLVGGVVLNPSILTLFKSKIHSNCNPVEDAK